MRTIYAVCLTGIINICLANRDFTESMENSNQLWEKFKGDFHRQYSSAEEEMNRFGYFTKTLKLIEERNAAEISAGGTAVHGITKFADMSQEEFEEKFLSTLGSKKLLKTEKAPKTTYSGSESYVDWTGVFTTPVKNQGECAAGWAFSATEQIESDLIRTSGTNTSFLLSTQQVTSCARGYGCGYGWTEYAFEYVKDTGGIEKEEDYPFTSGINGQTGTCKAKESDYVATVLRWLIIPADVNASNYARSIEENMSEYVKSKGPLSVCLFADNWNTYTGGIMSNCGENEPNHCENN